MDAAQLNYDVLQLKSAFNTVQKHVNNLTSLVNGLPCSSYELLELLDELANAELECREHFVRFADQNGTLYEQQSQECKDDWSYCHDRRTKAVSRLTRFAIVLREGNCETT